MARRSDILAYARSLIGTPFVHQGRMPGVGLDCVGLLVAVARHFDLTPHDFTGYPRNPDAHTFMAELSKGLEPVERKDVVPGDVLTFWVRSPSHPQHAAIASDRGLIHAYHSFKPVGVIEEPIGAFWGRRVVRCFRFPGLDPDVTPEVRSPL